jgi:hypothetical protein
MRTDAITKILLTLVALGLFLNLISTSYAESSATRSDIREAVEQLKGVIAVYSR